MNRNKLAIIVFALFFLCFSYISTEIHKSLEEEVIRELKNKLQIQEVVIVIGESKLDEASKSLFVNGMQTLRKIAYHHSSRINKRTAIIISQSDTTILNLYQDSKRPREFWVYLGENEVGRVDIENDSLLEILGVEKPYNNEF